MQDQVSVYQPPDAIMQSLLRPPLLAIGYGARYTLQCARCGAADEGWDHDDAGPLSCPNCIPHRLADYVRPPRWLQHRPAADQSWGLDRRINERAKEWQAVCYSSPSVRQWRRYTGKESFIADRRQLSSAGRI